MSKVIETSRLVLRPWRESDASALFKYASDERVSRLALWPAHTSEEMSLSVIRDIFMPNPDSFAIILKTTGEPIGCIGLVPAGFEHFAPECGEREVGYWLGYPYWGQGIATEALLSLADYYCPLPDIASLLITVDASNARSISVARKCGFRHVADYDCEGIPSRAYRLELRQEL